MYFFDKKTIYLVWNMREGQARGVGSVKFLAMDEVCRIELAVTGCSKVQGTYPVYVLSGDIKSLLGEIILSKGKGNLYIKCSTSALGHQAFPYKQVTGLYVDLKTEGYLEQKWLPMQEDVNGWKPSTNMLREERKPKLVDKEESKESKLWLVDKEECKEDERWLGDEGVRAESKRQMEEGGGGQGKKRKAEIEEKAEEVTEKKNLMPEVESDSKLQSMETENTNVKKAPDEVKPPEKSSMALYPNKWKQLCAIYPIVHPFQDGRAYLSIEPRDFVILQEKYQPLTQNSFLLHGFYHYRHLLLGRHRNGASIQYYLGVPGVFYEKEKAAALFYGFESFEGAVTPASEGSFGYYMKRVQI